MIPTAGSPADRSEDQRRLRKLIILSALRENGAIPRVEIAKVTGFNLRSTSMLVDDLVRDGLAIEQPAIEIPRGRRPTPVILNNSAALVLGVDIGRQRTIGRLMDLGGNLVHEEELRSPVITQWRRFAEWAHNVACQTVENAPRNLPPICGIGVGIPAMISTRNGDALFDYQQAADAIREAMQQDFDVEVFVDRDARMMALGYRWFGIGRQYETFAVLKIGVGLGVAIVMEGTLVQGANRRDMEFGHLPMGDHDVPCYCGGTGCLENIASGGGIERLARELGLENATASEVADLVRSGDKRAAEVFRRFSEGLGRAVATVINLFSPQAVVLSGRVTRAADLFFEQTKKVAEEHTLGPIRGKTAIIVSDPNARLGALGAISIVYTHIFHSGHIGVDDLI